MKRLESTTNRQPNFFGTLANAVLLCVNVIANIAHTFFVSIAAIQDRLTGNMPEVTGPSPLTWQPINPKDAPSFIRLNENGTFHFGPMSFSQIDQVQAICVNDIRVDKVPGEGNVLRVEGPECLMAFRYKAGQWEALAQGRRTAVADPLSQSQKNINLFFFCISFLVVPSIAGLLVAAHPQLELKGGDSRIPYPAHFWLGALAALIFMGFNFLYFVRTYLIPAADSNQLFACTITNIKNDFLRSLMAVGPFAVSLVVASVAGFPSLFFAFMALITFVYYQFEATVKAWWNGFFRAPRSSENGAFESLRELFAKQAKVLETTQAVVPWGGLSLPIDEKLGHFAMAGNNRSGKTINQRLLMQQVLPNALFPNPIKFPRGRAVVFDVKSEFVPIIESIGVSPDLIHVMNPLDARCTPWNMAIDTQTKANAMSLAYVLVPDIEGGDENDQFFVKKSRQTITNVIKCLHHFCGVDWTFRDLLLFFRDFRLVEKLLNANPDTAHVMANLRQNAETYGNIVTSVATIAEDYELIAACWHHATKPAISIRDWMNSNTVLVLGHDDSYERIFRPLNRCLVQTVSNALLGNKEVNVDVRVDRTWFFLDETHDLGKVPGLSELLTRGSGLGCTVVLGFQSIAKMQDIFGEKNASAIVGQCHNIALLWMGEDVDTAKWAADVVGKRYKTVTTGNQSFSDRGGNSTGTSEQVVEHYDLPPKWFSKQLPPTNRENGLRGVFESQVYGTSNAKELNISGDELFDAMLIPVQPSSKRFIARDPADQKLLQWKEDELRRFPFLQQGGNAQPDWTQIQRPR